MLAFQSIVDATVSTAAVVHALFDRLESNGSELVLFDINRLSGISRSSTRRSPRSCRASLTGRRDAMRARSSPTRTRIRSRWWSAQSIQTRQRILTRQLGLAWPPGMFSLSHIALPFTLDDDVYGRNPLPSSLDVVRLGTLSPRGERAVLTRYRWRR